MKRLAITVTLTAAMLLAATPAHAATPQVCATLQATDESGDGIPEYNYSWTGIAGNTNATGTWNGTRVVPNRPIPLIARLAAYGENTGYKFERRICAPRTPRLVSLGIAQPATLPGWVHATTTGLRSAPWGATNHAAYTAFLAEQAQREADRQQRERQRTAERRTAERAAFLATQEAEWRTWCLPGSVLNYNLSGTIYTWTC